MDLYGCFFRYAGQESEPYGLRLANVETNEFLSLYGEIEQETIFNKKNMQWSNIRTSYDKSQLRFEIDIVADSYIRQIDVRAVQKWLFGQSGYKKLYVYSPAADQDNTYLNCRFVNPEKIDGSGGLVGFRCTLECDSNMAWKDAIETIFTFAGGVNQSEIVTVSVDSDLEGYTYPRVEITTGKTGGDVLLINNKDNIERHTSFLSLPANATVIMEGSYNFIYGGDYYNLFNHRNFIRLLNGDNNITAQGDIVKLLFKWSDRRYL